MRTSFKPNATPLVEPVLSRSLRYLTCPYSHYPDYAEGVIGYFVCISGGLGPPGDD